VQAKSAGKSKAEVTQLLKDELSERGIELSEPLIRSAAGIVAHPGGLLGQVRGIRFGLRALIDMATQMGRLSNLFDEPDVVKDNTAGYFFVPDQTSGWVDVVVDDEGQALLRSRASGRVLEQGGRDMVPVKLEPGEPNMPGPAVNVYVEGRRVGMLADDDAGRYLPAISAARGRGGSLETFGVLAAQHEKLMLRIPASGTQHRG
jgi:hypothetical protein